jgi:LysR family transcriptional regulator, regulator for bpeEF and oprC
MTDSFGFGRPLGRRWVNDIHTSISDKYSSKQLFVDSWRNNQAMELFELQAFSKVVQAGSFTRAAALLGSQKAVVSRAVSRLEARLGARLLQRSTRSLQLTEVGREVFERAVGILGAVEDTERIVAQSRTEPGGVLRLTCGLDFALLEANAWIERYLQRYPQVGVEADITGRLVDLVHEGFDLAIRVGRLDDSRLAARKLGELRYGLFASRAYLEQHGTPDTPAELATHELLIFTSTTRHASWELLHSNGVDRAEASGHVRLRANNSMTVRAACAAGGGIAQLPLRLGEDPGATPLVRVLPEWGREPVPVHAVFPSSRYLAPKVRAFVDLAVQAFGGG